MHYRMLLWPHANARYQSQTLKLATAELELMLARLAPGAEIAADERLGMPCLGIRVNAPLDAAAVGALRRHSLLYGLFEDQDGLLRPVAGRAGGRRGAGPARDFEIQGQDERAVPAAADQHGAVRRRLLAGGRPPVDARPHVRPGHRAVRRGQLRLGRPWRGRGPGRSEGGGAVFQALPGISPLQAYRHPPVAYPEAGRQRGGMPLRVRPRGPRPTADAEPRLPGRRRSPAGRWAKTPST